MFYDPGERDNCKSTVAYSGNEITWEDLNALSGNDRLKLLVRNYGEFAMELQKYYGVPWEMPFAVMVLESNVGTDKNSVSYRIEQAGYYNLMGLTDGYGEDHYKNQSYSGLAVGQNTFSGYDSISQMLLGFFIFHARNGHKPDTSYDAGLKLLKPEDYKLREAIADFMDSYCGNAEEGEYCSVGAGIYEIIRTGEGTNYTGLLDVVNEMGWKNSEELAKSENIQPGGIATERWGWGDIRSQIWEAYGEAGLPTDEASKFGAITTTLDSGRLTAEVGGSSVLHSPTHEWLDSAGLEGYIKDPVDVKAHVDINTVQNGQYTNFAGDAGNGSGLPGFIVLHLTSASNFGARSWTNYCSTSAGGYCPPHFTIDAKGHEVFQHYPLSHPSAAVSNRIDSPDGSVFYADKYGIQIEIVGHGGTRGETCIPDSCDAEYSYINFSDDEWNYVAKVLMAISKETGIPLTSSVKWVDDYREAFDVRLSVEDIKSYIGVLGHEHINGKWDPLNVWKYIKEALNRTNYSYTPSTTVLCRPSGTSGIRVSLDSESDGGYTKDNMTYYWQEYAPSWSDTVLVSTSCRSARIGNPVATIGTDGCGYSAAAMVITALSGTKFTPLDAYNVAKSQNATAFISGCAVGEDGTSGGTYSQVAPAIVNGSNLGLKVESYTDNSLFTEAYINSLLEDGKMVLMTVGAEVNDKLTTGAHWVAIRRKTASGKWQIFSSSRYPDATVNDMEFDPSIIIQAHINHRSYWHVVSR